MRASDGEQKAEKSEESSMAQRAGKKKVRHYTVKDGKLRIHITPLYIGLGKQ